jgi:hypothetical protein
MYVWSARSGSGGEPGGLLVSQGAVGLFVAAPSKRADSR